MNPTPDPTPHRPNDEQSRITEGDRLPPPPLNPTAQRRHDREQAFRDEIRLKLLRRRRARQEKDNIFMGLEAFGIVGWSISVPTLLGIALGVWLDNTYPSDVSWTLTLMFAGVVLGCLNAWFWIDSKQRDD